MPILHNLGRFAFHNLGGLQLARFRNRGWLRILMYHRFPPEHRDALEAQCRHLRKHYTPVSLSDVQRHLQEKRPFPANAIAITVDDGYRDFQTVAQPLFRKYAIPATVFLITDFVDRVAWPWWDQVTYACRHTQLRSVEVAMSSPPAMQVNLSNDDERKKSARLLIEAVKKQPDPWRRQLLLDLPKRFQITLPQQHVPGDEPLSWDDVRALCKEGVEFGGHTQTHPILSRVENAERLRFEVAGCKARMEQELQSPIRHFCYPNGKRADVSEEVVQVVSQAGFATAVTTEPGLNNEHAEAFRLARIGVDPDIPAPYFAKCAAGLP